MTEIHTIPEWEEITGVKILDPDGFDRKDPNLYSRLFTKEEFEKGLIFCTIEWRGEGGRRDGGL